jgi:tetratricopeptide (TPR) repeat protein
VSARAALARSDGPRTCEAAAPFPTRNLADPGARADRQRSGRGGATGDKGQCASFPDTETGHRIFGEPGCYNRGSKYGHPGTGGPSAVAHDPIPMLDSTATRRRSLASVTRRAANAGPLALMVLLSGCGLLITPQHRIAVARKEIKTGQWQSAAAQLRTVIQGHPHNAEAWKLLARVSFDAGDISGARSSLKHAMAAGASGPGLDALRLEVWLAEGRSKDAIAALTGDTLHPGEPTAGIDLARAYDAAGQAEKAVAVLQPLLAQRPDLTRARVVLAEALARQGQPDQALRQLDTALQRDPRSPLPPLLKGRILAARGQYAAAEEALTLALKRMSPAEPIFYRTGALIVLTEARLAQGEIAAATQSQAVLARIAPSAPASQYLAGRIDLARGNLSAGVNELQGVVIRAPGFMQARLYLGAAELAQGNLQQAQQQLEQVVQAMPDNVQARNLLATVRLRLGDPEAALSVLTPALASQPADPGLLSLLGKAGHASGARPAVQALERTLRTDSKNQTAAINLARLQASTGDLAGAQKTLRTALAANPEALSVRLALAGVLVRTKAFPQAVAVLKAGEKPGAVPGLDLAIARVQLIQGDLKSAQATLDQAIAAHPGEAGLVEDAGVLLLEANQYGAALARFAEATVLAPNNALYWVNSARAQLALDDAAAARASLLKAVRIRPDWPPAVGLLALMDLHAGKGPAALQRIDALVAARPKDPAALALKGYVEGAEGHTTAALAAYTQAQTLHPTAQVALQLFRMRLASHHADAQKPLEDWLAREPGDWRVHEILGEYDLETHALRPAARQFEATVREAPDDVLALNNLAWVYSRLDDPRAESIAERAYKLAPQTAQVIDTLGWILARQHQAARAVPLLARAVKLNPKDPEVEYHYAYALSSSGNAGEAKRVLTRLLSTSQPFQSRADAQRLLAALKHT